MTGVLRATAVTGRWNRYRNESAQKADPVKKILPPLRRGLEFTTFRSRVRRSNHWAISAPQTVWVQPKFTSYMTVPHIDWNGYQNGYRNMTVSHVDWNGYWNMTVSHVDWNGYRNEYRNKSQHWKLTLEEKILPPLLPGLEPATFRPRVRRRRSTTLAISTLRYALIVQFFSLSEWNAYWNTPPNFFSFFFFLLSFSFWWRTSVASLWMSNPASSLFVLLLGWQDVKIQLLTRMQFFSSMWQLSSLNFAT